MTTDPPVPEPEPMHPQEVPPPLADPAPAGPHRPAWIIPAATGVAGLVLGAGLMAGFTAVRASAAQSALLTDAAEACGVSHAVGITLADGGRSITFDMKGEDEVSGADVVDILCLFGQLDMPSAVLSHVQQTTSIDGRQTETWDNLTVSWSYHPDRGLDGVLTVSDQ